MYCRSEGLELVNLNVYCEEDDDEDDWDDQEYDEAEDEDYQRMQRVPKVSVLKLDKDCYVPKSWVMDWVRLEVIPICRSFGIDVESVLMTKTRKGFHFYVGINPSIHAELANKIQWMLGDDCRRVDFNRARIRVGYARWNKLFEEGEVKVIYPFMERNFSFQRHRFSF